MSEFHQSPKHGGIMVVETGFPTSLIDLFFKNRDRLKKYSSKTERIQRLIETAPNASMPVNPDASLEKKPVTRSKIEKASDDNVCVCGDGTGAFVLMAFKLLIVAVLALSTTKSLAMGIALCAFALLFTENVATRILTRFKLCNTRKAKPLLASTHDEKFISCSEETEPTAVTENSNSDDSRIRDLSLKDEKTRSKSSRLKSKILKKLRSYKKKKNKTIVIEEETLADVSSVVPETKLEVIESERGEEKLNQPLIESKRDNMSGAVVIVIVLTGLLSGKIIAIGLTISCMYLGLGAAKKSGLFI
ncbi:hypothetical protein Bca4012_013328 [Brassica carinata]